MGAVAAAVACCLLAPALLGATWLLPLATAIEVALVGLALVLGVVALRRHRAARCCRAQTLTEES
jgi:hypothetical protein